MALIYQGEEIPLPEGVEVLDWRDHGLFFADGHVRRRRHEIRCTVSHHQGGPDKYDAHADAARLHRVLKSRGLSVHLQTQADGSVYQFCDLDLVTFHAGRANNFSIGMEMEGFGTVPEAWDGEHYEDFVHGRRVHFVPFPEAQVRAATLVFEAIHDALGIVKRLPRDAEGFVLKEALPKRMLDRYEGHLGHMHISPRKVGPSPHFLDHLASRWPQWS